MSKESNSSIKPEALILSRQLVLKPKPGCPWASEMVLNPAILEDPERGRIHMLFRATGPFEEKQQPGKPMPFPIFLGYAWSDDRGKSWEMDFSRPALAPTLATEVNDLYIKNIWSDKVVNHANGCIEDPRWFWLEGECYLVVACRMFAPGPYWLHDEPMQCAPDWAKRPGHPLGRAASENVTVNVLFKVNLKQLAAKSYEKAFQYAIHLTNPDMGEDRDVTLFSEKLNIGGHKQFVCLHRPWQAFRYQGFPEALPPSIMVCAADDLKDFWRETASQTLLAAPLFDWERDRIGASAPLLKLSDTEWLLCYHGKRDQQLGYSQSFMILEANGGSLPVVKHRCPTRILYPTQDWEMPGRFKSPVIFITGMIAVDGKLLVSYGAADERVGLATLDLPALVEYVRGFDANGKM